MIQGLVAIFLASILTENYILSKFLGICPFLGVSKKVNTAVGMSVAVTFVMVLSTAVTWPIYTYLLYLPAYTLPWAPLWVLGLWFAARRCTRR